ncbi:MAG: putative acetyltransferase [Yoonia sp.]|jgi:putative acetyltransferase
MIFVEKTDPHHTQASALLKQSHALMKSLFPPEDNFYLDIADLVDPSIHFFAARIGPNLCGTGALAVKDNYGEVKSMFVAEEARGKGVAEAILRKIEDQARAENLPVLKLETGKVLHAAHSLYRRFGFQDCGVFGDYAAANSSIFMEKPL